MSANLSNAQYVNITGGEVRITAFAQNSAGVVSIFTLPFSTPTGGISVSVDTILGRNREINDIFNKAGTFAGTTSGKEVLVAKDGSITLKDDFVYLSSSDAKSITATKSLMRSIAMGDIFSSQAGTTTPFTPVPFKVVGTNGVVKIGVSATSGKVFGLLTQLDGRLVVPQAAIIGSTIESITQANTRVTAYNKSSVCVMFEVITKFDEIKSEGYRFVYTLNSNFKYQEADDANEVSFDQMILCDVRYINQFFALGFSKGETGLAVPARVVKVGSASPRMFKSNLTLVTKVATITDIPTSYIKTDNTIAPYATTILAGDICIGRVDDTKQYVIAKCITSGAGVAAAWEILVNNTTNDNTELTVGTGLADSAYFCYDFDFETEDFKIVA